MKQRRRQRSKATSLYLWHRYIGLFATIFIILISLTGIALNHTDTLNLNATYLKTPILLDHYNIQVPRNIHHFRTDQHTVIQADDMVFVDQQPVYSGENKLIGSVPFGDFLIVSLSNKLLLLDEQHQLVETLEKADNVPTNIRRIGLNSEQQVFLAANGETYHLNSMLNIQVSNGPQLGIIWSEETALTEPLKAKAQQAYRSHIISLESFILDIHSGRFFGSLGIIFFDVISILLMILAITGVIIWLKQAFKRG